MSNEDEHTDSGFGCEIIFAFILTMLTIVMLIGLIGPRLVAVEKRLGITHTCQWYEPYDLCHAEDEKK